MRLRPEEAVMPRHLSAGDADHVLRNRAVWDRLSTGYAEPGRRAWASDEPTWGIWRLRERDVAALPPVAGRDVVELGCGTAYWSAWLARRGARVVGLDNSARQLDTARALQREHALAFPLVHGDAEHAPFRDASFDLALSEYGAAIWADPYRWIPEAARLLRPGGELIFLVNGTLQILTIPDLEADGPPTDRLVRPYFGMHRFEWPDETSVEFHLGYGDWIRLLRRSGFEVTDLLELRPPEGSTTTYTNLATLDWARRWPCEQVWKARRAR
jgi:SAM-dependent methyltransferase